MLVKYIDSDYIIKQLQKPSWEEVEEPDFYITMASNRVKALIFPSEQGNPNDITSYNEEQQEAIKLATAIYTMWYFDTNYDFTSGSVSVNFGGASMSESKTYNGEMVLPNVFDILKQANLIPTTETFIFNDVMAGNLISNGINPESFKNLQQEVERQADVNVKQDAKIVDIYDKLANTPTNIELNEIKQEITNVNEYQNKQDEQININKQNIAAKQDKLTPGDNITINNNIISAIVPKIDLSNYYNKAQIDESQREQNNKIQTNISNIIDLTNKNKQQDTKIEQNTTSIKNLVQELKDSNLINYVGQYQAGTTYKLGQVASFNSKMYLCKVESTTNEPTNTNDWDLLSAPEIDLSNYYNKQQIDTSQQAQDTLIATNQTNITTIKSDLGDLGNQVVDINNKFNEYTPLNAFNEFQTTTSTKQQEQDKLIQDNHNDINELMGRVETTTQDINNYVKYSVIKRDRNWELKHFNNTGKTLDGKPIYEGVIEFEASGETNLVNNCNVLLNVLIYNISDNIFIEPSSITLRVHNNYQIRGSFPSTAKNYRLYFIGVVRDVKGI